MSISDRYQRLLSRRAPSTDRLFEKYAEAYEIQMGENTKYILGAMKQVELKYTVRLIEQGDRVESQLTSRLSASYPSLAFRRQGSVSNNTHIRFASDVDVLAIIDKFVTLEPPQPAIPPYTGDPIDDLSALRSSCVRELTQAFPKATVDDTGSTSVNLSGGSLACPVDIVPSNWYDTVAYASSRAERDRGIQVLNKDDRKRVTNYPFTFNYRIDTFDRSCFGTARMIIRLLKTIKSDCEDEGKTVDFSSYDICSLVYRMPNQYFTYQTTAPLSILDNFLTWMRLTIIDDAIRTTVKVVDDSRLIFDTATKRTGATVLFNETYAVHQDALKERHGQALITEAHMK